MAITEQWQRQRAIKTVAPGFRLVKAMVSLFVPLLLVCACVSTAPVQEKRSSSQHLGAAEMASLKYPSAQYLTAVGSGQSEPEAQQRGKAELCAIFESEVTSELNSRTRSMIDSRQGDFFDKSVEQTIRLKSSVQLKGAQIGDTWKSNGQWQAIAVLNRAQARDQWLSEIDFLENRIQGELEVFHGIESPIQKLQAINRILTVWIEKQAIESRLRVIGANYKSGIDADVRKTVSGLPSVKNSILIYLDITGIMALSVKDHIAELLTDDGYLFTNNKDSANVIIQGTSKVESVDLNRDNWEFVRVTIALSIMDATTGEYVARVSDNTRAAHINRSEAVNRAIGTVSTSVARRIGEQFFAAGAKDS